MATLVSDNTNRAYSIPQIRELVDIVESCMTLDMSLLLVISKKDVHTCFAAQQFGQRKKKKPEKFIRKTKLTISACTTNVSNDCV